MSNASQVMVGELQPAPTAKHEKRLRHYWQRRSSPGFNDLLDLDLEAWGLVKREGSRSYSSFTLTDSGLSLLARRRAEMQARAATHNGLAERLAEFLRTSGRLAWCNIEFIVDRAPVPPGLHSLDSRDYARSDIVRPDVFSIVPTHDIRRVSPVVHEVKASRADFLADVGKPHKRAAYMRLAGAVYYVAAEGLIEAHEIPEGCGLLVERSHGVFVRAKTVRARRVTLGSWALLNLVLKSQIDHHPLPSGGVPLDDRTPSVPGDCPTHPSAVRSREDPRSPRI